MKKKPKEVKCKKCGWNMVLQDDGLSYLCSQYPFCTHREFISIIEKDRTSKKGLCLECGKPYFPKSKSDAMCDPCKAKIREKYKDNKNARNTTDLVVEGKCIGVFEDGLNKYGKPCEVMINTAFGKKKCTECRDAYHNHRRKLNLYPSEVAKMSEKKKKELGIIA
jgi:hypothetical protein